MPSPGRASDVVRFDVFQADLRAGELYKAGRKIKLQIQPFHALALLLERPGEVITREEFQRKLWPEDTFVDFDHSLNTAIKKLRQALGDDKEKPRFVETLPKRGYRFIGNLDRAPSPVTSQTSATSSCVGRLATLCGDGKLSFALLSVDENTAAEREKLDAANPRRVARALERCLASGRTLRELTEEFARQRAPFDGWRSVLTRLDRPAVDLAGRIEARVAAMLRAGLVDEVRHLRAAGLEKNPSAVRAIGYREVLAILDGKLDEAALADEIAKNTRALVKKQRTWFRTQLPAHKVVDAAEAATGDLF